MPKDPDKEVIYFAKTDFRNENRLFGIQRKDRRQHMYIIGKTGTGKSVLLNNMIVQDIQNGEGVCVIDPHGELVEGIIDKIPKHRLEDVVYFNPADLDYPVGFNVMELPDPRYKHLVASGLMSIFTKIWANVWSARMEYIMNNAILALLENKNSTLMGILRMLVDKDYRQKVISNVKDPVVKAFWIHEYEEWQDKFRSEAIAPIQNKVGQFLSVDLIRNVVGQEKSSIDIFDIMNEGKIFLVNVSKGRIGEDNSALLGAMLITKMQISAMERVRIPENERVDFYLYVDEFQNFVTESFAGMLSEARKYRLNLTIAHQYIGQLMPQGESAIRDAVFGNAGTLISFRVGAYDAEFLEKEFAPEFVIEDLVNLPNYHIYLRLMCNGETSRSFSAKTLPPFQVKTESLTREEVIAFSRKKHARHRSIVESEIQNWSTREVGVGSDDGPAVKHEVVCSACGTPTKVPFEPEPGRPVYCKDCLQKIQDGTMKPIPRSRIPKVSQRSTDTSALASIGIEFKEDNAESVLRRSREEGGRERRPGPRREPSSVPSGPRKPVLEEVGISEEQDGGEALSLAALAASEEKPSRSEPRERKGVDVEELRKTIAESLRESLGDS